MSRLVSGMVLVLLPVCMSSCFLQRKTSGESTKTSDAVASQHTDTMDAAAVARMPIEPVPAHNSASARPAQDSGKKPGPMVTTADAPPIDSKLVAQLNPIWTNRPVYKTFKGKAKVEFDGPDGGQSFTADFRVSKDSLIWINVVGLGISAARILITPDSIYIVNYLKEEITFRSLADAAKILPTKVDFKSLQNLLLGTPLRDGDITSAGSLGNLWSIVVEDSSYIQHLGYSKSDSTLQNSRMETHKPDGPTAAETYSNYEGTAKGKISMQREVNITNGPDKYVLKMNILKIEFDTRLEFPFNVPRDYSVK